MRYISVIFVTFIMIVGFSVIMMKFTGYWPCKIGEAFEIEDVSCKKNIHENVDIILNSSHISLSFHYPLLSLQNI